MSNRNHKSKSSSGSFITGAILGAGITLLVSYFMLSQQQQHPPQYNRTQPVRHQPQHIQPQRQPKRPIQQPQNRMRQSSQFRDINEFHDLLLCPISHQLISDPCILTGCGHTFQRKHIQYWLATKKQCPLCKLPSSISHIQTNYHLKQLVHYYKNQKY